ncbi:MAG: two component LuxR family transcriptional regulator [Geminicoccaceae bacterium]|nr:two component LuxR family transcriptional regulator [Geminicoccaceae bacterium]
MARGVIRTLVAAASPIVRADIAALLEQSPAITVVATSAGDALADDVESHEPQVVLMIADTEDANAVSPAALSRLTLSPDAASRAPAIVVVANDTSGAWVSEALRAGVRGIVTRDATPAEIVTAVEAAAAGLVTLPAEVATALVSATRPTTAVRAAANTAQPLTRRELEVLGMLAEGLANKNIAARLGISEHTVKTHVASILAKFDAYSRAEAVAVGVRRGLILL